MTNIALALTSREIHDLVRDDLKKVEQHFKLESAASSHTVTAVASHMQASGGKRLRPILLLLSARLVGDSSDDAIRMAAVMELLHTATLVHDDVIDMANTRRGQPSANAIWGNHVSVLAGDWIYMQAFQITLELRDFRIIDILMGVTQRMVEGELLQLERIGKLDISEADCMELIDRKTAALFGACAEVGAYLGRRGDLEAQAKLTEFAWNLGMAFQLVDDILDFTSRENILGKPVGNDLQEGKVTLPLLYALANANREEVRLVETVLKDKSYDRVPFSRILTLLEDHQGVQLARERAATFANRARDLILSFPDSPYRRALLSVTELVTDRDR